MVWPYAAAQAPSWIQSGEYTRLSVTRFASFHQDLVLVAQQKYLLAAIGLPGLIAMAQAAGGMLMWIASAIVPGLHAGLT
jgi:hypothetical protein